MIIIISAFLVCSILIVLIFRFQYIFNRYFFDTFNNIIEKNQEPQKFHDKPTPRIGGIPIFIGFILGILIAWIKDWSHLLSWLLILSALPVFFTGLLEDITRKISPIWRLLAAFFSAGLAYWLIGAGIHRLDVVFLDQILMLMPISFLFTIFAVGGLSHAMNIIDGYNGLASMVTIMILAALAYVSLANNDWELVSICIAMIGATFAFFIFNYPRGLIFAGDGGAYLWGFIIAEISVLLVLRHPNVSPWFPALIAIYPIWETIFSIYRRKILRGRSPGLPDALHLHSLIFKRFTSWIIGENNPQHLTKKNSITSIYLWGVSALSIVPALIFWRNPWILIIFIILFIFFYGWLYRSIVRFQSPKSIFPYKKTRKAKI